MPGAASSTCGAGAVLHWWHVQQPASCVSDGTCNGRCGTGAGGEVPLSRAAQIHADSRRIEQQILEIGTWEQYADGLAPFRAAVQRRLDERPKPARGAAFIAKDAPLTGTDGRLLSARRAEQLIHDTQAPSEDELGNRRYRLFYEAAVGLHRYLAGRGIDLMVVPVPDKSDIYPADLAPLPREGMTVQLQSKRVYLELMRAGVEVVDLEPALRRAAANESEKARTYMLRDTHWAPPACRIAAAEIGRRLARYDFVREARAREPRFRLRENMVMKKPWAGDLGENWKRAGNKRLPGERYRLAGTVTHHGKGVPQDKRSPVLVLGDSYAVYPYDAHMAVWAHLAREINLPVAVRDKAGGASWQARNIDRTGATDKGRRVVVWLFTNCSLYEQDFRPPSPARQAPGTGTRTAEITLEASPPKVDPAAVAYPNVLVTLPARVNRVIDGEADAEAVLVVLPLVRDRKLTDAARLAKGARLRVELAPTIPRAEATWMMLDETDRVDLRPYYVAGLEAIE